jgi:hypothetical protein
MLLCSWGWSTSSFGFGLFDPFRPCLKIISLKERGPNKNLSTAAMW